MRWAGILVGFVCACGSNPQPADAPARLPVGDDDRDGHANRAAGGDDCDDRDPAVHPGVPESCNGMDDDCSGSPDDAFECVAGADEPCFGVPGFSRRCGETCTWGACVADGAEAGCRADAECRLGEVVACETACGRGTRTCAPGCVLGPCEPPPELCNGVDDDCDGAIDEDTFGIAGPSKALPWIGDWVDSVAATTTPEGFALAYCVNNWRWNAPATPVVVVWTDDSGVARGDPVRLDDPAHSTCGAIDVVSAGALVAVVWEEGNMSSPLATHVAFADEGGLRVRTTIADAPNFWDKPRLAWTGDSLVVVHGRTMAVVAPDGTVLGDEIALPDETATGLVGSVAIGWDDAVVVPGDSALLWVALDGSLVRSEPLEVDAATAIAVDEDGISVATPAARALIRLDRDGRELWRAESDAQFWPDRIVRVGDRFLVHLRDDVNTAEGAPGGWLVDDGGSTVDGPRAWSQRHAGGSSAVVTNGDAALVAVAAGPASIAPLGCARPPEGG